MPPFNSANTRVDHQLINRWISPGSRVLDLGCGEGDLLAWLVEEKKIRAQGVELREESIYACVEKGLSVAHGDIESGLGEYPDGAFDVVILNHSLQETRNVTFVLREALRVGRRVVVGFPNFAYIKVRWDLGVWGRSPMSSSLPHRWYETPNVHFFSITDFRAYCAENRWRVLGEAFARGNTETRLWPNLLAESALFLFEKGE